MSLDPDPVFNAFVDSILDNAPDKEVGKLVLMHLRDLSHILEGRTISYPIAKNDPLLGEDPSAYRVLIRPLASVIGLFPPAQAFDFGAPDTNFSRLKAISALQATLRANGAAVRAIARVDDVEIPDFDLTFIPQCCLFSRTGTIDPKTLGERYDSGFLAELASCMEKVDTLPTGFTSSATLLLNIAFILNDDPSRNLHAVTEPIFRNASALNQVSPDLGQSYLECLVSLEHRSLAEVTESSEQLTRYAAGLIDNGSAHPSVAFQSLKELRGKLRIDDKVIDELLVLHRYTGFSWFRFWDRNSSLDRRSSRICTGPYIRGPLKGCPLSLRRHRRFSVIRAYHFSCARSGICDHPKRGILGRRCFKALHVDITYRKEASRPGRAHRSSR
jgi:hypothetical protein